MPKLLFLDASAIAKRYYSEVGSSVMNDVFTRYSHDRFVVLTVGLLEVASILVRKRNHKLLVLADYQIALAKFDLELIKSSSIAFVEAVDLLAFDSLVFVERHSINATDAMILRCALDFALVERAIGSDLILVSSDRRLIASAQAEGLDTFNPEVQTTVQLIALVGS